MNQPTTPSMGAILLLLVSCGSDAKSVRDTDAAATDASADARAHLDATLQSDATTTGDAHVDAITGDARVEPEASVDGSLPGAPLIGLAVAHQNSCAIAQNELYCWGSAQFGQLGDGTRDDAPHPTPVKLSVPNPVFMGPSRWANYVVTAQQELWVAGIDNRDQLPFESATFKQVTIDPVSMAVGSYDVGCVVMATDGEVRCMGKNDTGSVGDGTTENRDAFTSTGLRNVSDIAGGLESVCAISKGALFCWGHNDKGQLGNGKGGDGEFEASPTKVAVPGDVAEVALGSNHACALNTSNEVYCWGMNWGKQSAGASDAEKCGTHDCVRNPSKWDLAAEVVDLALSDGASCALLKSGAVSCRGAGAVVQGAEKVLSATDIASGQESNHFCARASSDIVCWGNSDAKGQLGRGSVQTAEQAAVPAPVLFD